ncbi:MAG: hypothetical protein KFH98_12065 [Gemmatimonadetes bacterium]|nr:hypothetical protein [Gemmatimonadota bacterium]
MMQGNADSPAGIQGYLFTPTLRAVVRDIAGSIAGSVAAPTGVTVEGLPGAAFHVTGAEPAPHLTHLLIPRRGGDMRAGMVKVVGLTLLAGACATVPMYEPRDWSATVESRSGSDVRATVRAATASGQTAVGINLAGGQSGGTHPWHIHTGTCGSGGGIVGDAAAYPPLRPGSGGTASATALVGVQLIPGQSYHVNVHRSPQALGEILGCGDLR